MEKKENFVSCDPGMGGGICIWTEQDVTLRSYKSQGEKDIANAIVCADKIWGLTTMVLERVWTGRTPGQASKLGATYGFYRGVASALNLKLITVNPITWEKELGLIGKTKSEMAKYAKQLEPDKGITLQTADAYLIGVWYAKNLKGEL
jgi:hypothetical protein